MTARGQRPPGWDSGPASPRVGVSTSDAAPRVSRSTDQQAATSDMRRPKHEATTREPKFDPSATCEDLLRGARARRAHARGMSSRGVRRFVGRAGAGGDRLKVTQIDRKPTRDCERRGLSTPLPLTELIANFVDYVDSETLS
jgi:hypothetical protein